MLNVNPDRINQHPSDASVLNQDQLDKASYFWK